MNKADYADMGGPYSIKTLKERWSQGDMFTATRPNLVEKVMCDKFTRSSA